MKIFFSDHALDRLNARLKSRISIKEIKNRLLKCYNKTLETRDDTRAIKLNINGENLYFDLKLIKNTIVVITVLQENQFKNLNSNLKNDSEYRTKVTTYPLIDVLS